MYTKNDIVTLTIDDIGTEGQGIGHIDGYALFVKDALPGDRIKAKITKVKKKYGYAHLLEVLTPSPDRVRARCVNASKCGGCQLQHYSYEKQLVYKQNKVRDCLIRVGGCEETLIDSVMEPIIRMDNPFNYRNKAQFPVGRAKDGGLSIGFYAGRTHSIIDCPECQIQFAVSNRVADIVRSWMTETKTEPYDEKSHTGLIRHILTRIGYRTGDVMVCLVATCSTVRGIDSLIDSLKMIEGLRSVCLNINEDRTNKILGSEIINIYGDNYIEDYIGNVKYRISPHSFYQVNPVQTEKLYTAALEYAGLTGNEVVWDLYCGIGTISLFLAANAKRVLGVEIVVQAIEDAKINAKANGITNAAFIACAAEDIAEYLDDSAEYDAYASPDVVVVDPPRKGCDAGLINTILEVLPEKIVYISCDPATLARDVRLLSEGGYQVERVRACDMFGMTVHVETVVMLSHKKTDSIINVKVEFGQGEGKVPLDNIAKRAEA
ncbi:MAG: 23S rRNA (uracil(1939)-C(5))-methyltransferase RlmD, partial [Lachnospiraceae bacterium]|nr:23S rRNA (uracil(1939)-C(5))-methyltransferase RlmD [Lachnospiraceae bacterium]